MRTDESLAGRHRANGLLSTTLIRENLGSYPLLGTGLVSPFKVLGDFFIEWLILKGLLKGLSN